MISFTTTYEYLLVYKQSSLNNVRNFQMQFVHLQISQEYLSLLISSLAEGEICVKIKVLHTLILWCKNASSVTATANLVVNEGVWSCLSLKCSSNNKELYCKINESTNQCRHDNVLFIHEFLLSPIPEFSFIFSMFQGILVKWTFPVVFIKISSNTWFFQSILTLFSAGNVSCKYMYANNVSATARHTAKIAGCMWKAPPCAPADLAKRAPIIGPTMNPNEKAIPTQACNKWGNIKGDYIEKKLNVYAKCALLLYPSVLGNKPPINNVQCNSICRTLKVLLF